jgi:hypothetical protein
MWKIFGIMYYIGPDVRRALSVVNSAKIWNMLRILAELTTHMVFTISPANSVNHVFLVWHFSARSQSAIWTKHPFHQFVLPISVPTTMSTRSPCTSLPHNPTLLEGGGVGGSRICIPVKPSTLLKSPNTFKSGEVTLFFYHRQPPF